MGQTKSRFRQFTDEQWERIEPLLPSNEGRQGHPFRDNRKIVEGIVYRYRAGIPWRDLADRACRYRGSGELVPLFRRPGTGPRVRRAGTVGGYSQ
jgi:transposase